MDKNSTEFKEKVHGKIDVHIGKKGISQGVIEQIENRFDNQELLKVKFLLLGKFDNMDIAAKKLSKMTSSQLLDVRGNTCILFKEKN